MITENIFDKIKGAAWQIKKPEEKKEMVNKLTELIAKGLKSQVDEEWLIENKKSLEAVAHSILRWPDRDNIRKHALSIAKRMPHSGFDFNKVFFVLRNSLSKVTSKTIKESYFNY